MLKQPNATTKGTDPFDQHRPECEPDEFKIREPYGIEVMHNRGGREAEIERLCAKVLAVVDGAVSGRVSFSEIARTDPKRDWGVAVRHLVNLKVLSWYDAEPGSNGRPQLNDYVWRRKEPRRRRGRR